MTISYLNNKAEAAASVSSAAVKQHHGPGGEHPRLPCRGCLASCENYEHCDGKPWRAFEQPQPLG